MCCSSVSFERGVTHSIKELIQQNVQVQQCRAYDGGGDGSSNGRNTESSHERVR